MFKVDNAVILAAGTSSRFAPLSYEKHKALTVVRGEVLIEREIRQLKEAGINNIFIVTGYKAEQFAYLKSLYGVTLIYNPYFQIRNNNSSIYTAKNIIRNTFICSADNYFSSNPFECEVEEAYYAAVYSQGETDEWCITQKNGYIASVTIGGKDSWYMFGHAFWDGNFSRKFLSILETEYAKQKTYGLLWEHILADHLQELKMKVKGYPEGYIHEFDTLDELRVFDESYICDTKCKILNQIAERMHVSEAEITEVIAVKGSDNLASGFVFTVHGKKYIYKYDTCDFNAACQCHAWREESMLGC